MFFFEKVVRSQHVFLCEGLFSVKKGETVSYAAAPQRCHDLIMTFWPAQQSIVIYFQPCASPRPLNTASKKTKMGAEKISWPTLADTGRHLADIWPTSDFIVSRIVFTIALVGPTCRPTSQNIWLRMIAGRQADIP